MFIAILRFAASKAKAPQLMAAHKAWIEQGFADGVFLLTGSLQSGAGGTVFAHNVTRPDLEARLGEDPFVAEGVVEAEIIEIAPGLVDARLSFLKA